MSVYLDASVLVSLFVTDSSSDRAETFIGTRPEAIVSSFAAAEYSSAIARRVRMHLLDRIEARAAFVAFDEWTGRETMKVAIEAADITLVRGDLAGVIRAIKLSRATYNKVVQGLFWAFFYNVVMVPLAILSMMHPVLAEIAMAISSITVVTNANLLRRVDIRAQYVRLEQDRLLRNV